MTEHDDSALLVDGSMTPGVYRVVAPSDRVAPQLRNAGWTTGELGRLTSKADFYAEVARALSLPDYAGSNLDALWDCLTDLTEPTALIIGDWAALAAADPAYWRRIYAVLSERTENSPAFAVLLTDPDSSDRT